MKWTWWLSICGLVLLVACGGGTGEPPATGGRDGAFDGTCSYFWLPGTSTPDLSACGSAYAHFSVLFTSSSPRNDIELCRVSITDEAGNIIIDNDLLEMMWGTDSTGASILKVGCNGGLTAANIGTYVYVTSRVSGSLVFELKAYNVNDRVVQTGAALTAVSPYPPTIPVTVAMTRVPSGA